MEISLFSVLYIATAVTGVGATFIFHGWWKNVQNEERTTIAARAKYDQETRAYVVAGALSVTAAGLVYLITAAANAARL